MILPTPAGARPGPASTRKVGLIMWGALLTGVLMFTVVASFAGPKVRAESPLAEMSDLLAAFSGGLSALMLVVSIVLPPRLGRVAPGAPPDGIALTRTIVAIALNEGAALFAIVVWMATGTPWSLASLAVSVGGILLAFPSAARWERLGGGAGATPGMVRNRMMR